MSQSPLLVMDTRSDRRDVWELLHRLPPRERTRFIAWACGQVTRPGRPCPVPRYDRGLVDLAYRDDSADRRLTNACYSDFWSLIGQFGLDPTSAATELERRVRKRPAAPPASAGPRPSRPA